jgi:hypothetical protein
MVGYNTQVWSKTKDTKNSTSLASRSGDGHRSHFAALFYCSSEDGGPLGGQCSARKQRANITQ